MAADFKAFHNRTLASSKEHADSLNWIFTGVMASLIYIFAPASDCPLPFLTPDNLDIAKNVRKLSHRLCDTVYFREILALTWLGASVFRVFFLASQHHAGPLLRLAGLKIEQQDGAPITWRGAVWYVLIEWLPFHLLSLYMLMFDIPADLYSIGAPIILAVTAQLIWLAPVLFRYNGHNIAGILSQTRVTFTDKKAQKVRDLYKSKWKIVYNTTLSEIIYLVITSLFIISSIQILRTPNLNPNYERLLYADTAPIWNNNLVIALEGATAPADVTDSYAYGRSKILRYYQDSETLKKLAHVSYAYDLPNGTGWLAIRPEDELTWDYESWKKFCFPDIPRFREDPAECVTEQDVQSYIQNNKILWDRYNALSDYAFYRSPPQLMQLDYYEGLASFGNLKAAQIIFLAKNGEPEKAFQEWVRYRKLYHTIQNGQNPALFKLLITALRATNLYALNDLLYLHPNLAKTHIAEIRAILAPSENFTGLDRTLIHEQALNELTILFSLGNINAIKNDIYDCVTAHQKHIQQSIYLYDKIQSLCPLYEPKDFSGALLNAVKKPGNFISNYIARMTMYATGGAIDIITTTAKANDLTARMLLLEAEILARGILAADIPAFVASAPAELQNPITRQPFGWDAQTMSLFFIHPAPGRNGKKVEVNLNLKP